MVARRRESHALSLLFTCKLINLSSPNKCLTHSFVQPRMPRHSVAAVVLHTSGLVHREFAETLCSLARSDKKRFSITSRAFLSATVTFPPTRKSQDSLELSREQQSRSTSLRLNEEASSF